MKDSRPAFKGGNQYVLPSSVCSPHLTSLLSPAALKAYMLASPVPSFPEEVWGLSWNITVASDKLSFLPGETPEQVAHIVQGQRAQIPFPKGLCSEALQAPVQSVQPTAHGLHTAQHSCEGSSNQYYKPT